MLEKRSVVDLHCCWSVNYTWCHHLIIYFLWWNSWNKRLLSWFKCGKLKGNVDVEVWHHRSHAMASLHTLVGHKDMDSVRKHGTVFYKYVYVRHKQMNRLMGVLKSWERTTVIVQCYHDSGQICTCSNKHASPLKVRFVV